MSQNPKTQALMDHLSKTDPSYEIHVSVVMTMVLMERHLRKLRAMANCYVPPTVLQEVDDFLQSTETKK